MKFDTTAIKNDSRLKIDMANDIALLVPSEAPFVALTKRIAMEAANSYKFEWLERSPEARWDAVNNGAGYANNATAIVVDNAAYFRVGMNVKVPRTGEVMHVTAVNTGTNTLTVKRGFGETAGAALVDNDPLLIVGNANEEGSTAPSDAGGATSPVYNLTQIFRTPFSVTNTANAVQVYGSNKILTQEQEANGIAHRIDMERAMLFGERYEDTTGTHPKRTTRGLLKFLTDNITNIADGSLSEIEFNNWLESVFAYGSKKKTLFASARLISVISSWGTNKLVTNSGASQKYGFAVTQYVSPHGELMIVPEPLFEGTIYGGYGVALDMANVKYRPLSGRDTKLNTNIQSNDADGRRDEFITEAGLQVKLPKTHGVLTGVTSAA